MSTPTGTGPSKAERSLYRTAVDRIVDHLDAAPSVRESEEDYKIWGQKAVKYLVSSVCFPHFLANPSSLEFRCRPGQPLWDPLESQRNF